MKTINVSFEDAEFEVIEKAKGKQSWREFIGGCAELRIKIKGLSKKIKGEKEKIKRLTL